MHHFKNRGWKANSLLNRIIQLNVLNDPIATSKRKPTKETTQAIRFNAQFMIAKNRLYPFRTKLIKGFSLECYLYAPVTEMAFLSYKTFSCTYYPLT